MKPGLKQVMPSGGHKLQVTPRSHAIHGGGDSVSVWLDPRPKWTGQHEHSDPSATEVLLVCDALIRGDEQIESVRFGGVQKPAVFETFPAQFASSRDGVTSKGAAKGTRRAVIEEYPHAPATSACSILFNSSARKFRTATSCFSSTSYHSTTYLTVAPWARLPNRTDTGSRVCLKTSLPPSLPGTLSTSGHFAQSIMPKVYARRSASSTLN